MLHCVALDASKLAPFMWALCALRYMSNDMHDIAEAWIELCGFKQGSPEHENRFWAWEKLNDSTDKNPEVAWSIITYILNSTDSSTVLDNLGAGPLEDMMCKHDRFTLTKIENEISSNSRLKECMSFVWLDSEDTDLYQEFYKLAGIPPVFDEKKENKNT